MKAAESCQRNQEVRRLYEEEGWSLKKIADHFGVKTQGIHQRLQSMGDVAFRPPARRRRQINRETLVKLYVDQKLPQNQIVQILKIGLSTLDRYLTEFGIERRKQFHLPQLADLQIGESLEVKKQNVVCMRRNLHSKAKQYGIKATVRKINPELYRVTRIG